MPTHDRTFSWNESAFRDLQARFPHTVLVLRAQFSVGDLIAAYRAGIRVFHVTANYHGRGPANRFI